MARAITTARFSVVVRDPGRDPRDVQDVVPVRVGAQVVGGEIAGLRSRAATTDTSRSNGTNPSRIDAAPPTAAKASAVSVSGRIITCPLPS